MLAIDTEVCIDCAACEPACPVGAIEAESEMNRHWLELNHRMSRRWPNVQTKLDPWPEADRYAQETGKFEKYFSENPGQGERRR
jgi:ferredoxin